MIIKIQKKASLKKKNDKKWKLKKKGSYKKLTNEIINRKTFLLKLLAVPPKPTMTISSLKRTRSSLAKPFLLITY